MKIGILTMFWKNFNYGGALQAYALQKKIDLLGYDSEQIKIDKVGINFHTLFLKIKNREIFYSLIRIFKYLKIYFNNTNVKLGSHSDQIRLDKFYRFYQDNVKSSEKIYNRLDIDGLNNVYDIFIVGSDQIWSDISDIYFLTFVNDGKGKISYAASISREFISDSYSRFASIYLRKFNSVSVREEKAKELLKGSCDNISVVLDPVFLLSPLEWDNVKTDVNINEPYLFAYMLGDNLNYWEKIRDFANQKRLKIVTIPNVHQGEINESSKFSDYQLFDIGPCEFIDLIKNANEIITDSFHGTAFSIIYNKNFWVLKRFKENDAKNMNSRIEDLFKLFDLKDRYLENYYLSQESNSSNMIDYQSLNKRLSSLKKQSENYIKESINNCRIRRS